MKRAHEPHTGRGNPGPKGKKFAPKSKKAEPSLCARPYYLDAEQVRDLLTVLGHSRGVYQATLSKEFGMMHRSALTIAIDRVDELIAIFKPEEKTDAKKA